MGVVVEEQEKEDFMKKQLRPERLEVIRKIKELHGQGIGKRAIARALGCPHSLVVYHTNEEARERALAYQRANQERFREQKYVTRERRNKEASERLLAYLMAHPCVDCGNDDPRVLEFDHREPDDKRASVAMMTRKGAAWATVLEEMAKCDVRCANCHRIRTYEQFGSHRAEWTPEALVEKGYR